SQPNASKRGDDSPTAVAHVRISGLLAAGLCDADDATASHGAADSGHVGAQAAGLRAGHKMAVQQHELCDRRSHYREGRSHAATSILTGKGFHAAGNDERERYRSGKTR